MDIDSLISYRIIGIIRTPYKKKKGVPIQSAYSNADGIIEIFPQYSEGLKDLDGFSHIFLIYHFNKVSDFQLKVTPFLDKEEKGIFATRAPLRPNPIGLSIVKLIKINIDSNRIRINGVDMLDETPLLDIKPYVPIFDHRDAKSGWLSKQNDNGTSLKISDGRF